ncbi:hypothetical protein BOTBODRAFT_52081 [Botryobasidium botryosum FD-172 SS1]|uniref:Uncharacterized protein n=1 Tax=Botryobasidium botryosum (strain FD-172 SS1) TaxID=930990 RepID=A0A067MTF1_BOTB1|nr:hypothetical protein BOTBODRAFT_52081 [Botryobasidium botryosum FD-172 SS1]
MPDNPTFAQSFPSVRSFVPAIHKAHWLKQPCNSRFVGQLESLEGPLNAMEYARTAGAKLRRAVVFPGALSAEDGSKLNTYFSSHLRSLHLELEEDPSPGCLEHLLDVTPNLAFLSFSINTGPLEALITNLNQILRFVSLLPLLYLSIRVRMRDRDDYVVGQKDFVRRDTYPESEFIPLVSEAFPDLRAVSLDWTPRYSAWLDPKLHWKRSVDGEGVYRLQAVSESDGVKWMEYYDWAWRDELLG